MADVAIADLALTGGSERRGRPLLVLGPSLGTSAATLWGHCVPALERDFDVLAFDLPGHGASRPPAASFGIADLAAAVLTAVEPVLRTGERIHYAGDSIGGAVGLQLMLDHPDRVASAVLLCTGARIGDPDAWHERAQVVRASGTAAVVDGSRERWFGPGFAERQPAVAEALLDALRHTDRESYACACEALAAFDVRHRLAEIRTPVLAVAGSADEPTPPERLDEIVQCVQRGRLELLAGVGHLAPAEAPEAVAGLICRWCSAHTSQGR